MSTNKKDYRDAIAAGNAEALQKLELNGFTEETQAWAWGTFKNIAKALSRKNNFGPEEWTAMEAIALADLLADDTIAWDPSSKLTLEQYLAGVIARKLRHAAAQVADDRAIWTESRRSLDMPNSTEGESSTLGDLVTDGADLNTNRKLLEQPRAVRIRNTIKRLRDTKNYDALELFRQKLRGEEPPCTPQDGTPDAPDEADDPVPTDCLGNDLPDEFADDAETLNRSTFDVQGHHSQAVAEMGYAPNEDDETPQRAFNARSIGLGVPSAANSRIGLKLDIKELILKLPPKYKTWCHRVKDGEDPVKAYKALGMKKSEYYKKLQPLMRVVFAELAGAY